MSSRLTPAMSAIRTLVTTDENPKPLSITASHWRTQPELTSRNERAVRERTGRNAETLMRSE